MALDKNTFGKTPAALYLVELLNQRGSTKLNRKVSVRLTAARAMIHELEEANNNGIMSVHNVGAIVNLMRANVSANMKFEVDSPDDEIIKELTANLIIGELKSLDRRVRQGRHLERKQARLKTLNGVNSGHYVRDDNMQLLGMQTTSQFIPIPIRVKLLSDDITPDTLQEKSRKKLLRRGKQNTLYPK